MASGWREHGGIYQWTRHALGPFAGLVRAWNFFVRALLTVSNAAILTARA
jgi:amino acid transporter